MPDQPPQDRRKRPRYETPTEELRRLRDSLGFLQQEAEAARLDVAAQAIGEAMAKIEADIKGRLV